MTSRRMQLDLLCPLCLRSYPYDSGGVRVTSPTISVLALSRLLRAVGTIDRAVRSPHDNLQLNVAYDCAAKSMVRTMLETRKGAATEASMLHASQ
jgi:hypothetical protein